MKTHSFRLATWFASVSFVLGIANSIVAQEDSKAIGDKPTKKVADSATKAATNENELEFVRLDKIGKKPRAMQTALVTYSNPDQPDGPKVTLVGAVHIAEASYYSQLNTLFRNYDALLYEMVMDPGGGIPNPKERGVSPVSTIQVGMKDALGLTFQLDEVDYKAKNFVHADMTPKEFFRSLKERRDGPMQMIFRSLGAGIALQAGGKTSDIGILAAALDDQPQIGLRRALAEQMIEMDGQMAALSGNDGKSTLITERNAKAFQILDQEIRRGRKNLGIFYGAGHLKDMHQRLVKDYQMKPEKIEWLDAWNLQ